MSLRRLSNLWNRSRPQRPPARPRRGPLELEPLEPRRVLSTLGLGIHLRADDGDMPGDLVSSVNVGDEFWIEVLAQDIRTTPQGVISLPLNLSWDPDKIELLNPPTTFFPNPLTDSLVTEAFELGRFVNAFDAAAGHEFPGFSDPPPPPPPTLVPAAPNISALRGAALPVAGLGSAIGGVPSGVAAPLSKIGFFSQLQFRALAIADDTPFTMQVAGSMSFADAAPLNGVAALTMNNMNGNPILQDRPDNRPAEVTGPELAVTEFIDILDTPPDMSSLSGFVYADTNLNMLFDRDANGVPTEIGLPNVEIRLFQTDVNPEVLVGTTTTGPDGWYHFEELEAGAYRIEETQPADFLNAGEQVGVILSAANPPRLNEGTAATNQFSDIDLADGEHGIDYNFGENLIPTKREFLSSSDPRESLCEHLGVECVTVRGTDGNDDIEVEVVAGEFRVTVNGGTPQRFSRGDVDIVVVDAGAGDDMVQMQGTSEDEAAHLQPGTGSLRQGNDFTGMNYGVLAIRAEMITTDANGGSGDFAVLRDTPQDDALVALAANGGNAMLTSANGRVIDAVAFEQIRALSLSNVRGGADEDDTADVDITLELVGDWTRPV